jgi:hypothetical protein
MRLSLEQHEQSSEKNLHALVDPFGLPICLRMIGCTHVEISTNHQPETIVLSRICLRIKDPYPM